MEVKGEFQEGAGVRSPVQNSQRRENVSDYRFIKDGSQKGARGFILCPKGKILYSC